jgi:site-specific DNA-methyltransferase (adenine-specific)
MRCECGYEFEPEIKYRHYIICGDCTDKATVERVMGGEKADIVLTDPPYNVGFDYGETGTDDRSDVEYESFSRLWFEMAKGVSNVVLFTPGTGRGPGHPNLKMWFSIEWPYWIIAWVKKNALGHSSLGGFNNWEPVLLYGKPTKKIPQDIYDIPITVQKEVADEDGNKLHPVPKQVSFFEALLKDFTNSNQTVIDLFLGSGTTLIACERLGRKCRAVEISPAYCAVAIQRWVDVTGKEPVLLSNST